MNQEEIGKFIAVCRKENNFTQEQLAERLGVSSKSISRWENGNTMPDYSILGDLCKNLNISINELFSCEKLSDEKFKEEADKNLLSALENSTFNLKEKISYYRKKWFRKHIINIFLYILLWLTSALILKFNNAEHLVGYFSGLLTVLMGSVMQSSMNAYVENNIYEKIEKK
ncbi:MAG: helix-turn-helix transcriptional regulator [Clostridia bacterium]|nr:helix-turn-helix transcriptional regulator [Clostridia bacterium]